jgi:hypothetical protein
MEHRILFFLQDDNVHVRQKVEYKTDHVTPRDRLFWRHVAWPLRELEKSSSLSHLLHAPCPPPLLLLASGLFDAQTAESTAMFCVKKSLVREKGIGEMKKKHTQSTSESWHMKNVDR